jgi:hypothetical protein
LTNGHSQGRDGAKAPGKYGEAETREPINGRRVKNDCIVTSFSLFRGAKSCRCENTVRNVCSACWSRDRTILMESAAPEKHAPVTPQPATLNSLRRCQGFWHPRLGLSSEQRVTCPQTSQPCALAGRGQEPPLHSLVEACYKWIERGLESYNRPTEMQHMTNQGELLLNRG